jgi:transposase
MPIKGVDFKMSTHGESSKEFKMKIMDLHLKDNIPIKIISEKFGISQSTIYSWRDQYRKYGDDAFVGCGHQRPGDAELRKLRKENEELKMQVEILKKVAAYQAQIESEKR